MSVAQTSRSRVLVVEDDPGLREGLGDLLEDFAEVVAVSTGVAALEALEASRYSVVLTDLSLDGPGPGGEEVIAAARSWMTPVLVLSGSTELDAKSRAPQLLPDGYLTKPFQLEDLLDAVRAWLTLEAQTAALALPTEGELDAGSSHAELEVTVVSWRRLEPGKSLTLLPSVALGVRVVEGSVALNGRTWQKGAYVFVGQNARPMVLTGDGNLPCLVVAVPRRA